MPSFNLCHLWLPGGSQSLLAIHRVLPSSVFAYARCTVDERVTRVAWLNRSTILYAGNDKWSIDNRVVILSNTNTQYSIKIHNVDVYDEGPYTCSVQTDNHPKTSRVHLIVQDDETVKPIKTLPGGCTAQYRDEKAVLSLSLSLEMFFQLHQMLIVLLRAEMHAAFPLKFVALNLSPFQDMEGCVRAQWCTSKEDLTSEEQPTEMFRSLRCVMVGENVQNKLDQREAEKPHRQL
ncbi:hypothetical protein KIL84_008188 [Mauremys mutica]|uniref:Ig-like domain-containing protein n=1 Tax=Mauremys mutica TaxID=74926 RepID=A0A9D3X4L4_9SAUR|nr:hypothetical protein KIL84_008188 [Mauremys mutica]